MRRELVHTQVCTHVGFYYNVIPPTVHSPAMSSVRRKQVALSRAYSLCQQICHRPEQVGSGEWVGFALFPSP